MKEFRINDKISILAQSENARGGFRHRAKLMLHGQQVDEATAHYQNRTWESYEFQSVMQKLVTRTPSLTPAEKQTAQAYLQKDQTDWSGFHATAGIAQMGDLLTKNKVESNIWKKRMLTAGLGSHGLEFPEGFDKLDEGTKGARLDAVISQLAGTGKPKKSKSKKHVESVEDKVNRMAGL